MAKIQQKSQIIQLFVEKMHKNLPFTQNISIFAPNILQLMATKRIDNIRPEMLRWAFRRAGYSEEKAVEVFPKLQEWLSREKLPTISQLQDFASKFFVGS